PGSGSIEATPRHDLDKGAGLARLAPRSGHRANSRTQIRSLRADRRRLAAALSQVRRLGPAADRLRGQDRALRSLRRDANLQRVGKALGHLSALRDLPPAWPNIGSSQEEPDELPVPRSP